MDFNLKTPFGRRWLQRPRLFRLLVALLLLLLYIAVEHTRENNVRAQEDTRSGKMSRTKDTQTAPDNLARQCRSCRTPKAPFGILLLVYGVEEKVYRNFADQVVAAARRIKILSPEVPIALATSSERGDFRALFDYIIPIREDHQFTGSNYENRSDGFKRQWSTRILYLARTPFATTLAFDTNIVACRPLLPVLQVLARTSFDLAVASLSNESNTASPRPGWAHNFAIAYKLSALTFQFFDTWFLEQVDAGVALNDQSTFVNAAVKIGNVNSDFKFKVLNPALAAAYASSNPSKGFFPRETRIIEGGVFAVHGNPYQADAECRNLNEKLSRRQIINNGNVTRSVFSESECRSTLGYRCKYARLWSQSDEDQLVPNADELQKLP